MKLLTTLFICLLLFVSAIPGAWAQATAQLSGTVRDQSGAVLPGVEITATQTETGVARMTVSNETGSYTLVNLPLGPYRLEAALPGFRSFVQTGIVLQVGSNPTMNIELAVGEVSESVEVQANASLVETRNLGVGQVMETTRIVELPLNGRNASELLLLNGGAVQVSPSEGGGMTYPGRIMVSSAGTLGTSTDTTLDGIRHVDTYDGLAMPLPFPDALAEFKTEIGGQQAQQSQGATVSAVTKSGTNAFHGNLFEFHRNDLFNARSYFARSHGSLKRNQFGGTIGGPIVQNKVFFFAGYQGTTNRQDSADSRAFVPTAAMLAGDFTTFASAACSARPFTLKAPFVDNRIDPALFSPVAVRVAQRLPKADNPCGEVTYSQIKQDNEHQVLGRADYQASDKHTLFGRMVYMRFIKPASGEFTKDNALTLGDPRRVFQSMSYALGSTYLINPRTVNSLRLSVNRQTRNEKGPDYFGLSEFGSNIYDGYQPHKSAMTVTSAFNLGEGAVWHFGTLQAQLSDDVSVTHGTHQIGLGGRISHARNRIVLTLGSTANFSFNGQTFGAGLADFLMGRPSIVSQATGMYLAETMNTLSIYGQDTWQVTPRLTASVGLRWEPMLPHVDTMRPVPYVGNFSHDRFLQGIRSNVFVNAPPGLVFPGDPEFQQETSGLGSPSPKANLWNTYWNTFSPRIGLAWDVQGNGRTSLRASYGLAFEPYPGNTRLGTQTTMVPYGALQRVIDPAGGLEDPWRTLPGGTIHPLRVTSTMQFPSGTEFMPEKGDLTPTYVQSWNLSIQREIVREMLLSVSYMGTTMVHLQTAFPLNLAVFVPGVGDATGRCFLNGKVTHFTVIPGAACSTAANTQVRRQLSFEKPEFANEFGRLAIRDNPGVQHYHGMLISVQRRPTRGLTLSANYTLGHCYGDYVGRSSTGYGSSVVHTFQDPTDRRRDWGNCEIDQRHAFNLTGVAQTPQFANRTLKMLASGWRFSSIYRRNSAGSLFGSNRSSGLKTITLGPPATAQFSSAGDIDRCLCDVANQRPNLVKPDEIYLDKSARPGTQWLNPAAFALPEPGTLGNLGRATIKLPPFWQFDASLARVFQFRENQNIEFRFEAYNVLNSFRPAEIDLAFTSAQFGKIRTALDPRIMQFALKYSF
jgi:hypothetical protein